MERVDPPVQLLVQAMFQSRVLCLSLLFRINFGLRFPVRIFALRRRSWNTLIGLARTATMTGQVRAEIVRNLDEGGIFAAACLNVLLCSSLDCCLGWLELLLGWTVLPAFSLFAYTPRASASCCLLSLACLRDYSLLVLTLLIVSLVQVQFIPLSRANVLGWMRLL